MSVLSRRSFLVGCAAGSTLTGCSNPAGSSGAAELDARVDTTRRYLYDNVQGAQKLAEQAAGILYMPVITEAGFFYGGSYGRGALRINGVSVDYYSATRVSFGLQFGAQQYAHALFFMTPEALQTFRISPGWAAGADIRYATPQLGESVSFDTFVRQPVVAFVFGQQGLLLGASLAGVKYNRIIP